MDFNNAIASHEFQKYYQRLFSAASKLATLDIMVRKQVRLLDVEYEGEEKYFKYAIKYESSNMQANAMFKAANLRALSIKEKDDELLRPSYLFQ